MGEMKVEKSFNTEIKETIVFLDFNDKIPQELLEDKIFIRIANLEDSCPFVQINDMVFKGTYDKSLGTNLFFKRSSNQSEDEFPFQKQLKLQLKFFGAQTNILNCKQMRVPPTTAVLPETNEKIVFNFKWDYEELLNKFEQGTLDLKDMVEHRDYDQPREIISNICQTHNATNVDSTNINKQNEFKKEIIEIEGRSQIDISEEPYEELKVAYKNLQELARRPVKRNIVVERVECDPKYKSLYIYRAIECKVLEPPLFSYFRDRKSFEGKISNDYMNIDINNCVRLGLIDHLNNYSMTMSENKKKKVFRIENFENLSLTARYSVLLSHIEALEKQVNSNRSEENLQEDEFGHTPSQTLKIFKKLLFSLQSQMQKVPLI